MEREHAGDMVRFSSFDVYPKTLQEFRQRTLTGAIVSLSVAVVISLLTHSERRTLAVHTASAVL